MQYLRAEQFGPWQIREYYPWEYDTKAQESIQLASPSDNSKGFQRQAKILQDRAERTAIVKHGLMSKQLS